METTSPPRVLAHSTDAGQRTRVRALLLIYFASGACSLIDEVVWVRLLKLTLGNTVYASSIVVSVFMAGLALGALIMGGFSDRIRSRLRLYALIELLITVSALSLPWLLELADDAYRWFYRAYAPTTGQLLAVQVLVSAALLLVPTLLMGATLPLLARSVTGLGQQVGHLVGRLYTINMLGAAVGCFLAGFFLIRLAGVMGTLYIAAGLNLLVAAGGYLLSRLPEAAAAAEADRPVATTTIDRPSAGVGGVSILAIAFFASGLISIGYELVWMRSLVYRLGNLIYVFSAVLTIYLIGNVIGAGIGSRLARHVKRPGLAFGVTFSLLGLYGLVYVPILTSWPSDLFAQVLPAFAVLFSWIQSFERTIVPVLYCTFLFIVPAVLMGIGFPLALQAWSNHGGKVGRSTGTVYGINTVGAVAGGLVTGFALIPLLGVQTTSTLLGVAGMWIGALLLFLFRLAPITQRLGLAFVPVLSLTVAATVIPPDMFRNHVGRKLSNTKLVYVREGVTTTVSVHESVSEVDRGSLILATAGEAIAGEGFTSQKLTGHFGVFLHPDPQRVVSVGFGSGETTACLARHRLPHIECVDISPELVQVALRYFGSINLGERLDEEIQMIYMDAKNYLHLTDQRYDLIINDSNGPTNFAESASLYTREYFQTALERLSEGGLFMTWVQLNRMPISCFDSILGTALEVFPHVTLWFPATELESSFFYLVGSRHQQAFSPQRIETELGKEPVRASIGQLGLNTSKDVLNYYAGDEDDIRRYLRSYCVNSDYRPFVEFNVEMRFMTVDDLWGTLARMRSDSVFDHIDWTGLTEPEQERWRREFSNIYDVWTHRMKLGIVKKAADR